MQAPTSDSFLVVSPYLQNSPSIATSCIALPLKLSDSWQHHPNVVSLQVQEVREIIHQLFWEVAHSAAQAKSERGYNVGIFIDMGFSNFRTLLEHPITSF